MRLPDRQHWPHLADPDLVSSESKPELTFLMPDCMPFNCLVSNDAERQHLLWVFPYAHQSKLVHQSL